MSFTIKLYKSKGEKIALDRTLTSELSLSGTLREECSILNPVIKIETSDNITQYNYAHIEQWHRYYFIEEIKSVRNGIWEITMHVDVLHTYASDIRAQKAIVARNKEKFNLYLSDPMYKSYVTPRLQAYEFPGGFPNSFVHILATNGGGAA